MTTEIKDLIVNNFPDLELEYKTKDGDFDLSHVVYCKWDLEITPFGNVCDVDIKDVSLIGTIEVIKDSGVIGRLDLSKYPIKIEDEIKSIKEICPKGLQVNEDGITIIFN